MSHLDKFNINKIKEEIELAVKKVEDIRKKKYCNIVKNTNEVKPRPIITDEMRKNIKEKIRSYSINKKIEK